MSDWLEIFEGLGEPFEKYSIYNLASIQAEQVGTLEDAGAGSLADIPDDLELTERQARRVTAVKTGQRAINSDAIGSFLGSVQYPLYFLDYETFSDVIPAFDGIRPYQQVPFQYSLHIRRGPGEELEHRDFLHEEHSNPVPSLLAQLVQDIGANACLIEVGKHAKGATHHAAGGHPCCGGRCGSSRSRSNSTASDGQRACQNANECTCQQAEGCTNWAFVGGFLDRNLAVAVLRNYDR